MVWYHYSASNLSVRWHYPASKQLGPEGFLLLLEDIWGGVTWVDFCWVRAAGLSEPVSHRSLISGQLKTLS